MFKELMISCYLFVFKIVFYFFKLFPLKNKITLVVTFEENNVYLYQEMIKREVPCEIFLLCKSSVVKELQGKVNNEIIVPFETRNLFYWFKSIYHLSTSKIVITDNYLAFLSAIKFKKNVECIQLWHAAGALKTFGLKDKSIKKRSKNANIRFRMVYEKFNKVVVGSEEMAKIFRDSFGLPHENILRTGVPRTDFFYDKGLHELMKLEFETRNKGLKGKRRILYAPTFRDTQLENFQIQLDIEKMHHELKDEYVLFIKMHPAVKMDKNYQELYPDFVYDFSRNKGINELLVHVDYLITDYSSIPFEFALLGKPMIFFPYDLEFYQEERGVVQDYIQQVPGPVAFETEDIIKLIKSNYFDFNEIQKFADKWNEYSKGVSSKKLVNYILKQIIG
jgi:teichoic acid glycerol-phosphate primase